MMFVLPVYSYVLLSYVSLSLSHSSSTHNPGACGRTWSKLIQFASGFWTTETSGVLPQFTCWRFFDLFNCPCSSSVVSATVCWEMHHWPFLSGLLTLACRVFGSPPALILTESTHPCGAEACEWLISQSWGTGKETGTLVASLGHWWIPFSRFPSLHYSACIRASDLCGIPWNQMKTFPSAVSAVPLFLRFINSTPTKSHTHTLFHRKSAPFLLVRWIPCCIQVGEEITTAEPHASFNNSNMSQSRKDARRTMSYSGLVWGCSDMVEITNVCVWAYVTESRQM